MTEDWEPVSDYDDQMTAVEDGLVSYDSTHCKHGTFVGGWAGPDYMCGYCEDGISDEDFAAMTKQWHEDLEKKTAARARWEQLVKDNEGGAARDEILLAFLQSEEGKWLFR